MSEGRASTWNDARGHLSERESAPLTRRADEHAVLQRDLFGFAFKHVGGEGKHLVAHLFGGDFGGHAAGDEPTAAIGTHAMRDGSRVAVQDVDIVVRDAEYVGHDLGEDGFAALPRAGMSR